MPPGLYVHKARGSPSILTFRFSESSDCSLSLEEVLRALGANDRRAASKLQNWLVPIVVRHEVGPLIGSCEAFLQTEG